MAMKAAIIIPARLHSSRLPRKLLLNRSGKTLIQHTYEAALQASLASHVCVAADCEEIANAIRRFGGNVVLTNPDHACGTDRIAEAALARAEFDVIVNVQGDEPELSGRSIDQVISLLGSTSNAVVSTLATPIRDKGKLFDPACVKVVFDQQGHALYFSRSPIPCCREWNDALLSASHSYFYQHIGIYAYRREFLQRFVTLARPSLEQLESLEQLRILYAGYQISVGVTEEVSVGIDTPADYEEFVSRVNTNRVSAVNPDQA
jgi:3-deoxy-manno-octulosonate cytidylyltransferase (CMP-KDO synthetase)